LAKERDMTEFKALDEQTLVAGQISTTDLAEARRHGVTLAWAVACREAGVPREELEEKAYGAGFSLAAVDHLL
jgi:protein tyrosine phosphatase (PTP) superfamily phosphohydrolase (DUF442 family)